VIGLHVLPTSGQAMMEEGVGAHLRAGRAGIATIVGVGVIAMGCVLWLHGEFLLQPPEHILCQAMYA